MSWISSSFVFGLSCLSFCVLARGLPVVSFSVHLSYLEGKLGGDPEIDMKARELIMSKGYPFEEYEVETSDGYLLTLHRIPHGRAGKKGQGGPVFIQHGLLGSSCDWLTNLANESLPFLLADAGFDVWLGNSRGNTYSRKHKTLSPDKRPFWKFSWDEMALKDLPASISFVTQKTNTSQINYVGFSQGTLMGFDGFSHNKTLAKQIKKFYAMGPVYTLGKLKSPIKYMAPVWKELEWAVDFLGTGEFLPNDAIMDFVAKHFCNRELGYICENFLFLICGQDAKQLNETRLPVYFSHTPAGASIQDMGHFAQGVLSGLPQMYDYGSKKENQKHYNQTTPPLYDVTQMDIPVVLFNGGKDLLADVDDVDLLVPKLKNLVTKVTIPSYEHLDFIWALDTPSKVYNPLIKMLSTA